MMIPWLPTAIAWMSHIPRFIPPEKGHSSPVIAQRPRALSATRWTQEEGNGGREDLSEHYIESGSQRTQRSRLA
jgi:hypothetical protein